MWAFGIGLAVTYICLWLIPFWLVWPVGVCTALYLVKLIQRKAGRRIEDKHILGIILGAWCSACYGLLLFLGY